MSSAALLKNLDSETQSLWQDTLYWVPVRHHSPACAYALTQLLYEVRPAIILIEGPRDCQDLVVHCQHADTRTPVAFLSQKGEGQDLYSAYFPLCDYSPEWVAMRMAGELNAAVQLIDLPYDDRSDGKNDGEKIESLMEESYLSHSDYLQAISKQLGCRDYHESWDKMFEQRSREELGNWREFFRDVYAYCALARRDYDPEVFKANGDYDREVFMATNIKRAMADIDGNCVVITGGFHTPELMNRWQALADNPSAAVKKSHGDRNWLIRFSYDQLDALNGYGAGMPSPAYYQAVWNRLQQNEENYLLDTATRMLIDIAHDNRKQKLSAIISSSEIQAAVFQSRQLANLRSCHGPGRSEVMDAVLSCYVKDSVDRNLGLLADARRVMCGDQLGSVPDTASQPPLLKETWHRGQRLGLDFNRTHVKEIDLDIYKNARHRDISRFFHLLNFCDISLASWQAGPDFVSGSQTDRVRERWQYAWTPSVESQLLEKVILGTTLEAIALRKITELEDQLQDSGGESRAKTAASLLLRACVMGMHAYVGKISSQIKILIHEDEHISSLAGCGLHLLTLKNGQAVLDPVKLGIDLQSLIYQCWQNSQYLVPGLEALSEQDSEMGVEALRDLYVFSGHIEDSKNEFTRGLRHLADSDQADGAIRGASLGILFQSGSLSQQDLQDYLSRFLQQNQDQALVLGVISGLIMTTREILWRVPGVLQHINEIIRQWPEDYFLTMLPSMRRLFSQLTPGEIDKLATELVTINQLNVSPDELSKQSLVFSDQEIKVMAILDQFVEDTMNKTQWRLEDTGNE